MEIGRYDTVLSPETLAQQVKGAAFKSAISKVSPHLFKQPENLLETQINPTAMDFELKRSFWIEYQKARLQNRKMEIKNVYKQICTYTHFYNNVLNRPSKLAWLVAPISGILSCLEGFQDVILNNIFEVLKMDNCYKNGAPNLRVIAAQVKVFEAFNKFCPKCSSYNGEGP